MGQSPPSSTVNDDDVGIPFLQGNADFGSEFPIPRVYCTDPAKLCESEDVLISVRAPVGAINRADRVYCIGRGLAAVRFTGVDARLGWHLLQHSARMLNTVAQGSTFEAVNSDNLAALNVSDVPSKEQRAITAILDSADADIQAADALVAKLRLEREGLLHDLLTRGIDESGALRELDAHPEQFKDTELGRIPAEWKIEKLGSCTDIGSGTTPSRDVLDYWEDGTIAWVKTGEVKYNLIIETTETITHRAVLDSHMHIYKPNTVLVAMYGQGDTRGRIAILGINATINQACAALVSFPKILHAQFLFYCLMRQYDDLRTLSQGSNQSNLNSNLLSQFPLLLPPYNEQVLIADILNSHQAHISIQESHRDKLRAIKTGLMDDLLTGRVRVHDLEG